MNPDAALLQLVSATAPDTIDEAIGVMRSIDGLLPSNDGLKWFNLLYLMVTRAVANTSPPGGWSDARWLTRLDVVFANLYFGAIANWYRDPARTPRAWQALFEARHRDRIARVQFAIAGMNAHINHDLPIAVVRTGEELQITPQQGTPQHQDFEYVNSILENVEPGVMQYLASGIIGEAIQDLGKLGSVLAMWSVRTARDTAWKNAEILWEIRNVPSLSNNFLLVLDRMTGYAGRGLLIPLE